MPQIMTAETAGSIRPSPYEKSRNGAAALGLSNVFQDASDAGCYRVGSDGMTELPLSSEYGGIEGSPDPRGLIVPGQRMEFINGVFVSKGENRLLPLEVVRGNKAKPQQQLMQAEEPSLDSLPLAPPPIPMPVQKGRKASRQQRNQEQLEGILQTTAPAIPFSMTGNFGSFDGECRYVIEGPKMVVVIREAKQAGYTPPTGNDFFTLSALGRNWEVCYLGLSFKYEAFQGVPLSYTIFIRKPEKA